MTIWSNSRFETYFADGSLAEDGACVVKIDAGEIRVEYGNTQIPTCYVGFEDAAGHFYLQCDNPVGETFLHRMPGNNILNGWWKENGQQGMWRIHLIHSSKEQAE